jgi:hypothetical protein
VALEIDADLNAPLSFIYLWNGGWSVLDTLVGFVLSKLEWKNDLWPGTWYQEVLDNPLDACQQT